MAAGGPPVKMGAELQSALRDDALYKARNDAKFRAVAQRVDYETFKNMVSVAHLRPLQAPNTRGDAHHAPAWSFDPDGALAGASADAAAAAAAAAEPSAPMPLAPPATGADFERAWRSLPPSPAHRAAYLRAIPADALPALFKVEVNHAILGEMLVALAAEWRASAPDNEAAAAAATAATLGGVACAGRFSLTARLLSRAARDAAATLFAALAAAAAPDAPTAAELARLRPLYGA